MVTLVVAGGLHAGLWHFANRAKGHLLTWLHPAAEHQVKVRAMTPAEIDYVKATMAAPPVGPPAAWQKRGL